MVIIFKSGRTLTIDKDAYAQLVSSLNKTNTRWYSIVDVKSNEMSLVNMDEVECIITEGSIN